MKQRLILIIVIVIALIIPTVFSLTPNEEFLCSVVNDTWKYFNASTSSTVASSCYDCTVLGHGFPRGSKNIINQNAGYSVNPAEVGLYMASVVSAYELGFVDRETAMKKLKQTLDTLYYLQNNNSQSYKGLFYQWYNIDNTKPARTSDYRVPSVDNAWLALSLVVINKFGYERGNTTIENLTITILKNMNFSLLFNEDNKLNQIANNEAGDPNNEFENNTFVQYYDSSTGKYSGTFWNIYGDEGRIIGFIARVIEKKNSGYGIINSQLNKMLNVYYHPWLFEERNYSGIKVKPVSWTGSYFTYSSPGIFLKEFTEFMGKNATQALLTQMQFASDMFYTYFGQTSGSKLNGGYEDFGVPPVHSWNSGGNGYKDGGIASPSVNFLALVTSINSSITIQLINNAKGIKNTYPNAYRTIYPYGYVETIGVNASNNGSISNVWATLTHGLVLNSIADYLKNTIWHYSYEDPDVRSVHLEYNYKNNTPIKQSTFSCFSKPISQGNVVLNGTKLYVNGTEFKVKGIGYNPIPIGESPNLGYVFMNHPELFRRDLPLLRDMGANTVRTWAKVENDTFLDIAYNNGDDPIYVLMGMWIDPNLNFSVTSNRTYVLNQFEEYVTKFKDHPAVLAWAIGNEENYRNKKDIADWYILANELARKAYEIEGVNYHPTLMVNGDLKYIGNATMNADDSSLDYTDMWGSNAYRGYSFNSVNFFDDYHSNTSKPLLITEYGIDSFNNSANKEYEEIQSKYLWNLWDEINASNITIGGVVMEYSDEWWKNSTGNANTHDSGGYSGQCDQPDCVKDEEYWGIMRIIDNGTNLDILKPKQAYYTLKNKFSNRSNIFQKGFTFSSWWYNDYSQSVSNISLELLNQTGTKYVSLIVSWYQDTTSSASIYRNPTKTPSDEAMINAIKKIHSLGMKVMLKPHIEVADGSSRTDIIPSNWNEWFANYSNFINYYANFSEKNNVDQFSIGTELKGTTSRAEWLNIIEGIRNIYSGPITYAANFDEYSNINWWNNLDYIGIDAYFSLTNKYDPTLQELKDGWDVYKNNLSDFYNIWKKPIIFTEIGYQSINGTNIHPWWSTGNSDLNEQKDSYEAAFKVFWNEPWFYGMYWWHWYYNYNANPDNFTIYNKSAEKIVRKWYKNELNKILYLKNSSDTLIAYFDDLGDLVLKGILQQTSSYTATSNDEFRFQDRNGNDLVVVDLSNGNMYIDGTLLENQNSLNPSQDSDDLIIKDNEDNIVAYINESGYLFLKGSLIQNGI